MILEEMKTLYLRDIKRVKKEISLYKDEANLWITKGEIKNSGGNLCLHLIGNLKTFIGQGFAATGYVRDREFEFNGSGVSREELLSGLDETLIVVDKGLSSLTVSDLEKNATVKLREEDTSIGLTLMHLQSHLNYHLGQLNYHRRMIDG